MVAQHTHQRLTACCRSWMQKIHAIGMKLTTLFVVITALTLFVDGAIESASLEARKAEGYGYGDSPGKAKQQGYGYGDGYGEITPKGVVQRGDETKSTQVNTARSTQASSGLEHSRSIGSSSSSANCV